MGQIWLNHLFGCPVYVDNVRTSQYPDMCGLCVSYMLLESQDSLVSGMSEGGGNPITDS